MTERRAAAERRQEIIDATLDLAAELGPDNTTTRKIASRIGISEPGIFRHFPKGKSELWVAVARTLGKVLEAQWDKALKSETDTYGRIRALIRAHLGAVARTPALPAIIFSRSLQAENEGLKAGMRELIGSLHGRMAGLLREGQERGEISPDTDVDAAGWLFISVIQGVAMRWILDGQTFELVPEGLRIAEQALSGVRCSSNAAKTPVNRPLPR